LSINQQINFKDKEKHWRYLLKRKLKT